MIEIGKVVKRVALVGAGQFCKELLKDYFKENIMINIIAIMDNDSRKWGKKLSGISIVPLSYCKKYDIDEYWISSIYFAEDLKEDLCVNYQIEEEKIHIIEDVNLFMYYRIRSKYKDYIEMKKECYDNEMSEIINYMKDKLPQMFCYDFTNDYLNRNIDVLDDTKSGMFYVIHKQKKLYFSKQNTDKKQVRNLYNCLCMEQDERSPHKYLSKDFDINQGDVVADVGASEGMFILDNIDKIQYAYLFEENHDWVEALKKTFEPYQNKIQIIEKYVSCTSDGRKICLDDFFKNNKINFIKMDIEGEEINALLGAEKIMRKSNIKASICAYHNKADYNKLIEFAKKIGYKYTRTKGYLLCIGPWERGNLDLDFRRGIVRLEKK